MKVKDLYWAARNSTFFINLESEGRPLLCEPRLSDEGGVRIRLWLRDPAGTGTGGAIALLSRDEAAVLANAIDTRRNWVGEKADANAVLNESLTDNVLKQHYIDALSNADQLVVVPDGADTLVQTK